MPRKLVVGNWKMNGSCAANRALVADLRKAGVDAAADVAVCVPFPYLQQVGELLAGSAIRLGAQNVSAFEAGAHTGEVSCAMLREFDCHFVIVGHSERRVMQRETSVEVAHKAAAALAAGLVPIVCVGETLAERETGKVEAVLQSQLDALGGALTADALARVVIAYEPVWAIGTGVAATPAQVQAVLGFVRDWLEQRAVAANVPVLYGGSVKPDSAQELFGLPGCDGGLIGGASLVAADFVSICEAARLS